MVKIYIFASPNNKTALKENVNSITIITICFNNLEEVKMTCKSVESQAEPPYEHIIIDGSTNEEIKEWLNNNLQPAYRKWVCERDKGISDAFNKGVKQTTGTIINFMNSGDKFYDAHVLAKVAQEFDQDADLKWLHGAFVFYRGGIWLKAGTPFSKKQIYKGMRQVMHQSMYVKKELFDQYGLFDLERKVAMDYDFLIRIRDEKVKYLTSPLCQFAPDGTSYENIWEGLKEVSNSYQKYIGFSLKQKLWKVRAYLLFWLTQKTSLGKWLFQLKNNSKKI